MTVEDFLRRLLLLYGAPESADDKAFLDEYRKMLAPVDKKLLEPASNQIRDTHLRRGWPTPAEVRLAIVKASEIVYGAYKPPEQRPFAPDTPMTDEQLAEHEVSKARVDAMAKKFIASMRGPARASRPVELPWLAAGEFEELMAKVPDSKRAKTSQKPGSVGGFTAVGEALPEIGTGE